MTDFTSIGSKELLNSAIILYSFFLVHRSTEGLWRYFSHGLAGAWTVGIKAYQQPPGVCATVLLGYIGALVAARHSWVLLKAIGVAVGNISSPAYQRAHNHLRNSILTPSSREVSTPQPQSDVVFADGTTKAMVDFIAETSPTVESLVQQYNREEVYSTLKYPGIYQNGPNLVYKPGNLSQN